MMRIIVNEFVEYKLENGQVLYDCDSKYGLGEDIGFKKFKSRVVGKSLIG